MVAQISPQGYCGIDFRSFITKKTQSFTGRGWIFKAIHEWFSQPSESRFLLLNGKPGSGKTAIAARLCQFSHAKATPSDRLSLFQAKGFLAAYHFCSARDSNWIDPRSFVWSVALQLAKRHEEFAKALVTAGDTPVNLRGEASAGVAEENAVVAGVIIKNLSLSGLSSQEAFNRFLLGPLQNIYQQGFSEPITILVDSLDESLNHSGNVTIASLLARVKHLPAQVRFIVTSRDDDRLTIDFLEDSHLLQLSESNHISDNDKDIAEFVHLQISEVSELKKKTTSLTAQELDQLIQSIVLQAEGNFLYVSFLLNSLAMPQHPLSDLDSLPSGLEGLYYDSIKRVVSLGSGTWEKNYSPLMGVLSVAQSPLTIDQIEKFTGQDAPAVWSGINELQQFITKSDTGSDPTNPKLLYRLYHQSVIDFLRTPQLRPKTSLVNNSYLLQPLHWHLQIVNHYMNDEPDWRQWDDYGPRYFATHLATAANLSKGVQQHQNVERLVKFVSNRDFWLLHKQRINDLVLLQRDLDRSLKAAASANSDTKGLPALMKIAMASISFRREELRPEPLFDLARQGDIAAAISRLELFEVDADWKLVALLVIAWLAEEKRPEEARRLRDQVKDSTTSTASIGLLISRLNADLDDISLNLKSLPLAPPEEVVSELVANLGGKEVNINLLMGHRDRLGEAVRPFDDGPDSTPGYFSERDGLPLVAYAEAHKPDGDKYFRQYIAIHSSYNYVQYRNRSLLHLLDAALQSPDKKWAQEMAVSLAVAALAGNAVEFQEGIPLTFVGESASNVFGDRSWGTFALDRERANVIHESNKLQSERGQADSWGFFRRKLGSLAQVYALLLNDPNTAINLLETARSLPYGFAGFNAPASLFLAEATQVSQPLNLALRDQFLEAALSSAHNIQDIIFCARSTARVNAMRKRWWSSPSLQVDNLILRICADPFAPEFTALHRIGEAYERRAPPPQAAELPVWFRCANSLSQLAEIYQRPVSEFVRVNRQQGWSENQALPAGTEVNIPDPGFATQISARLSAEALNHPTLSPTQRVSLIQQLVPLASFSPTALDTVFARLILAAHPLDEASLFMIQGLALNSLFKIQPPTGNENYRIFFPPT